CLKHDDLSWGKTKSHLQEKYSGSMKSGMGIRDIVGQGVEPAIAAAPGPGLRRRRDDLALPASRSLRRCLPFDAMVILRVAAVQVHVSDGSGSGQLIIAHRGAAHGPLARERSDQ